MTATYDLIRSDRTTLAGEYRWFVLPVGTHAPAFSPEQSGDAGQRACVTWLESQGCRPLGETYPECMQYGR